LNIGEVTEETRKPTKVHANMKEIYTQLETTAPEDGKGSQRAETGIQDLPTEVLLDIFEYLIMKELCSSVVPGV
jgi:hypothetical protein